MQCETEDAALSKVKATRQHWEGCASPALTAPCGECRDLMAQEKAPGGNDIAQNQHCLFKPQWLGFQGLQWLEQEETTGSILILFSNFSNPGFDDYAGFYGSFSSKMSDWTQAWPPVGLGSWSPCGAELRGSSRPCW